MGWIALSIALLAGVMFLVGAVLEEGLGNIAKAIREKKDGHSGT